MDDRSLALFLSHGGALANELPSFEERKSQKELALFINQCIGSGSNALCEAGTGIGKTLAYLLPLMMYALESGERCLVSTETIALQDQLFTKDVPLLRGIIQKTLKKNINAVLALGSANYLCRARYNALRPLLCERDSDTVEKIDSYLSRKKIFSRLDLSVSARTWEEVCRDSDLCRGGRCGEYASCPFQNARKSWFESSLIITNHSLFFSNIAADKKYLPQFDIVVFDEAHATPEICRRQNGFSLSKGMIEKSERILKESSFYKGKSKELRALKRTITKAKQTLAAFFDTTLAQPGRITTPLKNIDEPLAILEQIHMVTGKELYNTDDIDAQYLDTFREAVFSMMQSFQMLTRLPEGWVIWCDKNGPSFTYNGEPLSAHEIFNDSIYTFYKSIIFISATLTVGNKFDFFEERCGISHYKSKIIGTEFDYRTNAMVYLPPMPEPTDKSFIQKAAHEIERLISLTSGKTLILFNSYEMLQKICDTIRITHTIISQRDYSAFEAVSLFKASVDAVLMGTHSFWQGIDIAGDALSNLIIMRLPFAPPDRPDIAALCESFEDSREAFMKIQLPLAVLKFRQGFGRLIRSNTDTGIISILDNRIVTKRYGKLFLESVPPVGLSSKFETVEKFYRIRKGLER